MPILRASKDQSCANAGVPLDPASTSRIGRINVQGVASSARVAQPVVEMRCA